MGCFLFSFGSILSMHRCCLLWIGLVSLLCVCVSLEFPAFCLRCFTSPKVGNTYVCSFLWECIVLALMFRPTLYIQSIFKCGMRKESSLPLWILHLLLLLFTNSCLLSSHNEVLAVLSEKRGKHVVPKHHVNTARVLSLRGTDSVQFFVSTSAKQN